eukprot:4234862-Alexandrium_andersonii.AAC.1
MRGATTSTRLRGHAMTVPAFGTASRHEISRSGYPTTLSRGRRNGLAWGARADNSEQQPVRLLVAALTGSEAPFGNVRRA